MDVAEPLVSFDEGVSTTEVKNYQTLQAQMLGPLPRPLRRQQDPSSLQSWQLRGKIRLKDCF
jgi:hypothetical protein